MSLFSYLAQTPAAFVAAVFILGLLVGSFLNVLILRLPKMLEHEWRSQCQDLLDISRSSGESIKRFNLWWPPSECPDCHHRIRAWENIPVLSFLALRGRCSNCKGRISPRYPLIELLSACLAAYIAWHFGFSWETLAALILTWTLIALSIIDLDHQLLPDHLTLPLLWLGLVLSLGGFFTDPQSSILGAAIGYLSLWTLFHVFRLLTGKEGMGYGDFKLLAMLGAWLGWQALPAIILISSLVGALIGITMILALGRDRNIPIPFGPYLAIAGWLTLLWGDELTSMYLGLTGL